MKGRETKRLMARSAGIACMAVALGAVHPMSAATGAVASARCSTAASVAVNRCPMTTVMVTETEFHLELSQTAFSPGRYTFVAVNAGTAPHALAISGPGVFGARTAELEPGESGYLTVSLQPGEYELWCPIGDHREEGMEARIQVDF